MTRERIENDAVRYLFLLEPMTEEERARQEERRRAEQEQIFRCRSQAKAGVTAKGGVQTVKREGGQGRAQRPLPVRFRQEVQEVPRSFLASGSVTSMPRPSDAADSSPGRLPARIKRRSLGPRPRLEPPAPEMRGGPFVSQGESHAEAP